MISWCSTITMSPLRGMGLSQNTTYHQATPWSLQWTGRWYKTGSHCRVFLQQELYASCVCVQASVSLVTAITARIARKRSRDPGCSANTSILLLPAAAESYSVFRHQRSGPIIGWDPVPTEGNHSAYYVSNNSHWFCVSWGCLRRFQYRQRSLCRSIHQLWFRTCCPHSVCCVLALAERNILGVLFYGGFRVVLTGKYQELYCSAWQW